MTDTFHFTVRFLEEFASTGRADILKRAFNEPREKLNHVTWLLDYCRIPYKIEENEDFCSVYCNSWFEKHMYRWNDTFKVTADILRRVNYSPAPYVNIEMVKVKPFVEDLEDFLRSCLEGLRCSFDIYKTNYQFIVEILD